MTDLARTKDEAILDIRYASQLHALHRGLYRRVRAVLAFTTLALGTAAITAAIQAIPGGVTTAAVAVACCAAIDVVCNFTEKAVHHELWRREYVELLARSEPLTLVELDAERLKIQGHADNVIGALRIVAFNDNARSSGHEDWVRPEKGLQRFMRALA